MWDERIEIEDLEFFCRFMRTMSYFDVEISSRMEDVTDEEKEEFINENIEKNPELSITDELEEFIPLATVVEMAQERIKKDPITQEEYLETTDAMELQKEIALKILYGMFDSLDKMGYLDLCWDADKNDFTYEVTDLGKRIARPEDDDE